MPLSDLQIRKAKKRDKAYKLTDGGGLFLLVKPNGSRLWQQKYRFGGKERLLSLGQYPDVSLAQARSKRDDARAMLAEGTDPSIQKRLDQIEAETKARTTFLLVAEEYLEMDREKGLSEQTMKKKVWQVHRLAAPLHQRPINEITSAEVLHLLKKIEESGRRETAKKLRGTISAIFRLAVMTLRAENDPTYAIRGALLAPKVVHRPAITDDGHVAKSRPLENVLGFRIVWLERCPANVFCRKADVMKLIVGHIPACLAFCAPCLDDKKLGSTLGAFINCGVIEFHPR